MTELVVNVLDPLIPSNSSGLLGLDDWIARAVVRRTTAVDLELWMDLWVPFLTLAAPSDPSLATLRIRARLHDGVTADHVWPLSNLYFLGGDENVVESVVAAHLEAAASVLETRDTLRSAGLLLRCVDDRRLIAQAEERAVATLERRLRDVLASWICPWLTREMNELVLIRRIYDMVRAGA